MSTFIKVAKNNQIKPIYFFNNIIQYSDSKSDKPKSQMHRISLSDFNKNYKVLSIIGQGSFGRILKIRQLSTNTLFALKKITVEKKAQKFQFMKEIQIQKRLSHPLIVKIFEFYIVQNQNQFFKTGQQIGIIMQLGKQSLQQIIENKNIDFTIDEILKFAIEFIYLFAWLQQRNIVHRDIKPANIINFSQRLDCKLADFGLCRHIQQINNQVVAGSIHYLSPLLKKKYHNKKLKTRTNPFKDDMYSLGMTLYQLTTKQMKRQKIEFPFSDVYQQTKNKDLAQLINLMLQNEQAKRPDFKQLCAFIQKNQYFFKLDQKSQMEIQSLKSSRKHNSSKETPIQEVSLCSKHGSVSQFSLATIKNTEDKIFIKSVKKYLLNKNTQIQSLQILDNYIFVGCTDGNIKVFDSSIQNPQILFLGKQNVHKKQVSVLCKDKKGTLWSAAGDGNIYKWSRKKLFQSIRNNVNHYINEKKNIFGQKLTDQKLVVELAQDTFKRIQIPFNHKGGISALLAIDEDNFVAGFYDGFLYIMWKGQQIHIKHHKQPITALRLFNQTLYSSSFEGVIKIYDLEAKNLQNKFYQIGFPICSFQVSDNIQNPSVVAITVDGNSITIQQKQENSQIQVKKLPTNSIFTTYISNQVFMYISQNGELYNNLDLLYKAESRGWNCMICSGGKQIIAASFSGQIIILSW